MDAYRDASQLWDFSHPTNFSQLPDDDFLAMLHKQYPSTTAVPYPDAVNPQNIARYSISSGATPSSDDSSPSPPHSLQDTAGGVASDDVHDPALKRKASDDGLDDEGPSQKAQHTSTPFPVAYQRIYLPILVPKKASATVVASRRKSASLVRPFLSRIYKHLTRH